MVQWLTGLSAINSLAKTLMVITQKKATKPKNNFSDVLKSELKTKELSREKAEKLVSLYDVNHDQKISARESGMTVQEFQQWDTNKDGYITAQEIQMLWSHLGPFKGLKD
ncbi:MAG: hypothetical protein ACP5UA_05375 [Candidatus Hydrogenedens sp.]